MNCPRPSCGGLLIKIDEESGHEWKCSACSRRWPATKTPGPAMPQAMQPPDETMPDEGERAEATGRRCLGRQGRGQCKKDAEDGRAYCHAHNGQATVTADVPRAHPAAKRYVDRHVKTPPPHGEREKREEFETPPNKIIDLVDQELASLETEIMALGARLATLQDKKHCLAKAREVLVNG